MRINIVKVIVLIGLISFSLAYSYEEDEELVFQKLKEKLKGVFSNKDKDNAELDEELVLQKLKEKL